MLEPLGKSQVLSYLKKLSVEYNIYLISFEKKNDSNDYQCMQQAKLSMEEDGIYWSPLCYHNKLKTLSTLYDILNGFVRACLLIKKKKIDITHSRSYVATIIAYLLKKTFGTKYIFDIRGFWVDEKVESNSLSGSSILFRSLKKIEKSLFKDADVIVTLTNSSIPVIQNISSSILIQKINVIPTCVDLEKFSLSNHNNFSAEDKLVIGYVGSVGGMYDFKKVIQAVCYIQLLVAKVELIVITKSDHLYVNKEIKNSIPQILDFKVFSSDYEDIPQYLNQMNIGIYFYNRKNSKTGCAPTRLAEFLACGVPVIVNPGIGDQDDILFNSGNPVGASISNFNDIDKALDLVKLDDIQQRCRNVASDKFSLSQGVAAYSKLYNSLL